MGAAMWLGFGRRRRLCAGGVLRSPRLASATVRYCQGRRPSRPRADPDAITSMDMEGMALDPALSDSGLWKLGKAKETSDSEADSTETVVDFEAVKAAEAKAAEEMDDEL